MFFYGQGNPRILFKKDSAENKFHSDREIHTTTNVFIISKIDVLWRYFLNYENNMILHKDIDKSVFLLVLPLKVYF